jgi:hypothetical protein
MYFLTNQFDYSDLFNQYIKSSWTTLIKMMNEF